MTILVSKPVICNSAISDLVEDDIFYLSSDREPIAEIYTHTYVIKKIQL